MKPHLQELAAIQERQERQQAALKASWDCPHPDTEARKKQIRGGGIQYVMQCLVCGEKASQPISKTKFSEAQLQDMKPFDDALAENQPKYADLHAAHKAEFDDWYARYRQTSEWKAKRDQVLKRDNHICQGCGGQATLAHHTTYRHVGQELLFELISLCNDCHEVVHEHE